MEFNSATFTKALNDELVGKRVGYAKLDFYPAVRKVLNEFVKNIGFESSQRDFDFGDWSNSEITISYKKHVIGRANFKKQRGKFERGYFGGGTYNWTFKECHALFWNDDVYSHYAGLTFKEMLDKIDESIAEEEKKKQSDFEFAKELYKLIREKCKEANRSDCAILEIIDKKRYDLLKALETSN